MHNHNVYFVVIAVLLTETTVILAEGNIIQLTTSTSDSTVSQSQPSQIQGIVLYSMNYTCFIWLLFVGTNALLSQQQHILNLLAATQNAVTKQSIL